MPEFLGLPCVELKNEVLSMLIASTVGPRILSLRFRGGENLFAEVPDFALDCPGAGKCQLWGGHRLWIAPEVPRRTYVPDDVPVAMDRTKRGLRVSKPTEKRTGLQKSMEIELADDGIVTVMHTLENRTGKRVKCQPWAITQFKTGGFAVLWHERLGLDKHRLLHDREIRLWPYTDIRSPFITWGNDVSFVSASMKEGALKLGFPCGSLSYYRNGTLFTKTCDIDGSYECYCNPRFLELETLASPCELAPGESVTHEETWEVEDGVHLEPSEQSHARLMELEFKRRWGSR